MGIGSTSSHSRTRPGTPPGNARRANKGRPVQAVTFKECGHTGLGLFCHRCKQAEVLEERIKQGVAIHYDHKFHPSKKVTEKATKDQLKAMQTEAVRLRGPMKAKANGT